MSLATHSLWHIAMPLGAVHPNKAGQAQGAAATNFDDSDWPNVDLPHDWAVAMPFDRDANPSQGYRRRG